MLQKYFNSFKTNWKENAYLLSLAAFLIALPTSIALISITAVVMLIVWVFTGNYKEKWNRLLSNKNALLMMCIPCIYLIGLCFTQNFSVGIQEFNKSLYWLIFAFVLGSSSRVSHINATKLLSVYVLAVTVAAGAALLKLLFVDSLFFSDFRSVTWINHIPFSFQIAFSIWIVFYYILNNKPSWIKKSLLSFLILFLIITLFALKSFNGYLYFGAMSLTALIMLAWRAKTKNSKFIFGGAVLLITIFPVVYIYHCVQKFYNTVEYSVDEIPTHTNHGNIYKHNFDNKIKENGNYIGLFLCEEELIPLWDAHSCKPYFSKTPTGYSYSSVVIRYMTSKGLTKDAEGFAQLSSKDIENIENEIPNYIYAENKLRIYPRIYETIWEIDQYRIDKNPNQKSLAQRIELALLAVKIIERSPWIGVGLGNSAQAYAEIISESESKLAHPSTGSSHNQYLNYLIRFGIIGTVFILGIIFWVFFHGRKNYPFFVTIFFISMLAANFGDANWETFVGLNFFAFFSCFFMWVIKKNY